MRRIQELRAEAVEHILEHGSLSSDRGRELYEELLALHLAAGLDPTILIRGGEALGKARGWINASGTMSRAASGDDSYRREFMAQLQARREEQARAGTGSECPGT